MTSLQKFVGEPSNFIPTTAPEVEEQSFYDARLIHERIKSAVIDGGKATFERARNNRDMDRLRFAAGTPPPAFSSLNDFPMGPDELPGYDHAMAGSRAERSPEAYIDTHIHLLNAYDLTTKPGRDFAESSAEAALVTVDVPAKLALAAIDLKTNVIRARKQAWGDLMFAKNDSSDAINIEANGFLGESKMQAIDFAMKPLLHYVDKFVDNEHRDANFSRYQARLELLVEKYPDYMDWQSHDHSKLKDFFANGAF